MLLKTGSTTKDVVHNINQLSKAKLMKNRELYLDYAVIQACKYYNIGITADEYSGLTNEAVDEGLKLISEKSAELKVLKAQAQAEIENLQGELLSLQDRLLGLSTIEDRITEALIGRKQKTRFAEKPFSAGVFAKREAPKRLPLPPKTWQEICLLPIDQDKQIAYAFDAEIDNPTSDIAKSAAVQARQAQQRLIEAENEQEAQAQEAQAQAQAQEAQAQEAQAQAT